MTRPGLSTDDQVNGHRYATRGMSKTAVPRDQQIVAGRSSEQTTQRQPKTCRGCMGVRDTRGVFCTRCQTTRSDW